jgi:hypothetical protein
MSLEVTNEDIKFPIYLRINNSRGSRGITHSSIWKLQECLFFVPLAGWSVGVEDTPETALNETSAAMTSILVPSAYILCISRFYSITPHRDIS